MENKEGKFCEKCGDNLFKREKLCYRCEEQRIVKEKELHKPDDIKRIESNATDEQWEAFINEMINVLNYIKNKP